MKIVKYYIGMLSEAFDGLGDSVSLIIIIPIVIALLIAIGSASFRFYVGDSLVWALLTGSKHGVCIYLFLNILWWGLFIAGVVIYSTLISLKNWARKE